MSRFRASGAHFLISAFVACVLLSLCWFIWYPAPLLVALGGHELFLLIIGVDVVLGPLLTLAVFKPGKKSLRFDLSVIALLQVAALFYGMNALLAGRPVYAAALGKEFQVVLAPEVTEANLAKATTRLPWWGPSWVGTKAATEQYDRNAVMDLERMGAGRGHLPQLHIPYATMANELLANAASIETLKKHNPTQVNQIDAWLDAKGINPATSRYQPIKMGASRFVVLLNAENAAVLGIAQFRPD